MIDVSMMTMNWARAMTARAHQRRGSGVGMSASFVQEPGLLEPYSGWVSERRREAAVRPVASTWLTARPRAQRVGHDEDAGSAIAAPVRNR
jgi:hypothetical protein